MIRLCFILLVVLASACAPEFVSEPELNLYLADQENELSKSTEVSGTTVNVIYRPTDLWIYNELRGKEVRQRDLDSIRHRYDPYYYFIVSFSRNGREALHQAGDMGQYSDLVSTMSFRMAEYVTLTTAKQDTIPVGDFMLNRTYGMASGTELLFAFNKAEAKGAEWVQVNLNEFGLGIGNQRFRFETNALDNTPKLKFITIDK
jgi:hypothetical protein